jgi:hypothetical protein
VLTFCLLITAAAARGAVVQVKYLAAELAQAFSAPRVASRMKSRSHAGGAAPGVNFKATPFMQLTA